MRTGLGLLLGALLLLLNASLGEVDDLDVFFLFVAHFYLINYYQSVHAPFKRGKGGMEGVNSPSSSVGRALDS